MTDSRVMNKTSQRRLHMEVGKEEQVFQAERTAGKRHQGRELYSLLGREWLKVGGESMSSTKCQSGKFGINPVGSGAP